jgi:UDP-N-acetylmuramyl pentapeptide phosphotransferase/UDP-N-acetylglucosamine-1-phosphate transferase
MTGAVETWQVIGGFGLFAASAAICAVLIVVLRPYLQRYALARPNARSSHVTPTPQGGGIAVIAATLGLAIVIIVAGGWVSAEIAARLWPMFTATAVIAVIGAIDDIRTMAIAPRLLLQAICVAATIATLPAELHVVPLLPFWLERLVMLLAGVWFVNLVNFMDGIDWMTVAEVVPVTLGLVLIGLLGALTTPAIVVAIALCGAMIGFAPFNRPVARLFLGDVGSLPIGLLLLWLLLLVAGNGHLAAALILPLYYLADSTITLIRRMLKREPFWESHRSHFYQRATQRGLSVPEVVARVFAVNVALVVLATATILVPGVTSSLAAMVVAAAIVGWLLYALAKGKR